MPGMELSVIEWLDPARKTWRELHRVVIPGRGLSPHTVVESIDPRVPIVPANLLRFSVTFSSEMEEGSATGNIELLDASGAPMPGTLLEMPPELWDRAHRRITVLLEPGRIKRGLQPHQQAGPPLSEGDAVTLAVDATIRDADGSPLVDGSRRRFRVGPPIRSRVNPAEWEVRWPATPGEPLVIRFDRPLDRALVYRCLRVLDAGGRLVEGAAMLDDAAQSWTFAAAAAHEMTGWIVRVDRRLEDLAGNSVRRVFDRDLERPEHDSIAADYVFVHEKSTG